MTMNPSRALAALALLASLQACTINRYCATPQAYEKAPSIPPLVGIDNLKIPSTATALKVPDAKGDSLTFGYVTPDPKQPGKTRLECLDKPPPIPPIADASK